MFLLSLFLLGVLSLLPLLSVSSYSPPKQYGPLSSSVHFPPVRSSRTHSPDINLYSVASILSSPSQRLTPQPPSPFTSSPAPPSVLTLKFDPTTTFQSILGFGGALTEAVAINFAKLPTALQDDLITSYYSSDPFKGHHYTLGRIPMGSSDFSPASYSFDDVDNDYYLLHFDEKVTHDTVNMIPLTQRVIEYTNDTVKLFVTPWSPPAWMKNNNNMLGSDMPCLKSDPLIHSAWAQYYIKFMTAYSEYNIHFWGMTIQNEPEYAAPWEACTYTPELQRDFLRDYLGPAVKNSSFSTMNIMIYDHNKDDCITWADTIYADPIASSYIWGEALHWYSPEGYDHVNTVHQHWPTKHLLATESTNCPGVIIDSWERGEAYGHDILNDLENWVEGWTDWNIIVDEQGGPNHLNNFCDAPIIGQFSSSPVTIHYQPMYYFLGHFSRFILPGSIRIAHAINSPNSEIEITSFLVPAEATGGEGNTVVFVILNRSSAPFSLNLQVSSAMNNVITVNARAIYTYWFDAALINA